MHKDQGFTLMELTFAVIILGGLAAIALPNFLGCANKAKQSEAKQYVGSMNRAQQSYILEKKAFGKSVEDLGLGIKTQTDNYDYSIRTTAKAAFSYGVARKDASKPLKSYVGAVFVVPSTLVKSKAAKEEMTTVAILCQAISRGTSKPAAPTYQNGKLACGSNTHELR
jgi:prepilin-type N-terminal cleavage/methylation domain-containing protein